ncbi:MAG: prepilin-type N-terminal cleavage/methylation domain-containing protein, partial [Lachnospiraceae bacterium]|nr:prepilin-type N-terminal cleavage/methylation domain-containing protein [Lachnospiraceae bacterium]
MKKKNDDSFPQLNKNAGFSLVELLIAVIILAIIVVPLLHGFVTSARMNGKARQTQRAITVAQDLMEGLKAYDIEELKEQFNNPENGFYVMDQRMVQKSIGEDYFEKIVTGKEDEDIEYRHVAKEDVPSGIYYFTLEGIQIRGSEFDAVIRIDATNYMEGKLSTDSNPDGHYNAFNSENMAFPNSVLKGKSGMYYQSISQDLSV